jgi:FMN phosphatase YigB (HAD superfamily)
MKTLFIDFDGTICHDRFWRSLTPKEYNKIQKILFQQNADMVVDWMKGKHSSEEINCFVANETGIEYSHLWEIFKNDCQTMLVDMGILDLLQKLRKQYHLVLITGNMDCFDRFTAPALHLEKYFDVVINSFNERQLKSDDQGATFIKYLQGPIQQSYLIEDSANSCNIFAELGGSSLQVTPEKSTIFHLQHLAG